jgi:plastocyanin
MTRGSRGQRSRLLTLPLVTLVLLSGWGSSGTHRIAKHQVIEMSTAGFHPQELEVAVGDTVVWVNHDLVPHTSTAADSSWDTGAVNPDQEGRFVPKHPGTFVYSCTFHPVMRGKLIVR